MNKNLLWKMVAIIGILLVFVFGIFGIPQNFSRKGLLAAITKNIHLGLDLSGGTHLILQVQVNDAVNVDSDNAVEVLKQQLNKKKINFSDVTKPDPTNTPDRIVLKGVPPGFTHRPVEHRAGSSARVRHQLRRRQHLEPDHEAQPAHRTER